jgi:hypothetical protein
MHANEGCTEASIERRPLHDAHALTYLRLWHCTSKQLQGVAQGGSSCCCCSCCGPLCHSSTDCSTAAAAATGEVCHLGSRPLAAAGVLCLLLLLLLLWPRWFRLQRGAAWATATAPVAAACCGIELCRAPDCCPSCAPGHQNVCRYTRMLCSATTIARLIFLNVQDTMSQTLQVQLYGSVLHRKQVQNPYSNCRASASIRPRKYYLVRVCATHVDRQP